MLKKIIIERKKSATLKFKVIHVISLKILNPRKINEIKIRKKNI